MLDELHMSTFGCTNNVKTVFNLLPYSLEHVRRNCSDSRSNPLLQLIQIPNLCAVYTIFNIAAQKKKSRGVLNPVNAEIKELDHPVQSIYQESLHQETDVKSPVRKCAILLVDDIRSNWGILELEVTNSPKMSK